MPVPTPHRRDSTSPPSTPLCGFLRVLDEWPVPSEVVSDVGTGPLPVPSVEVPAKRAAYTAATAVRTWEWAAVLSGTHPSVSPSQMIAGARSAGNQHGIRGNLCATFRAGFVAHALSHRRFRKSTACRVERAIGKKSARRTLLRRLGTGRPGASRRLASRSRPRSTLSAVTIHAGSHCAPRRRAPAAHDIGVGVVYAASGDAGCWGHQAVDRRRRSRRLAWTSADPGGSRAKQMQRHLQEHPPIMLETSRIHC